jgi:hypothetical protein
VLPDNTVLLVTDRRTVECFDPQAKTPLRWSYRLGGTTSTRSGVPPLVIADSDHVIVAVPGNLGVGLARLDRATGKALWRRPPLVDITGLDPKSWIVSGKELHHAEASTLRAWSLADGKPLFDRPLPTRAAWHLARSGQTLLAYPGRAPGLRFQFRWLPGAVQYQSGPWPGDDNLSVLCLDAASGEMVQRLNLAVERTTDHLDRHARRRSLFPWIDAGLAPDGPGLSVRWDRAGLVLGAAGSVRVLTPDS